MESYRHKLIIPGGVSFEDIDYIYETLDKLNEEEKIDSIIVFDLGGFDDLAISWAFDRNVEVENIADKITKLNKKEISKALSSLSNGSRIRYLKFSSSIFMSKRLSIIEEVLSDFNIEHYPWDFEQLKEQEKIDEMNYYQTLKPNEDGIAYINIYSKGKSTIGRELSNFTDIAAGIETPEGKFRSIEGYWYYLNINDNSLQKDNLKEMSGYAAKSFGQDLRKTEGESQMSQLDFRLKIKAAILNKLFVSEDIFERFMKSDLPFVHFYYYGAEGAGKLIVGEGQWLIKFFEDVRREIKSKIS